MYEDLILLSNLISPFVVGMEGNISKKTEDGLIIKASGSKLKNITQNDFVLYDYYGNQLNNLEKKGSMELSFHTYLLESYNFKYVCHSHPTNLLKILISDKLTDFAHNRYFPDQVVFNGKKSCIVPYGKPGVNLTNNIKESLTEFIKNEGFFPKIILLENHGLIVCGNSIDECVITTEICEKSAEIFTSPFKKNPLSPVEIEDLINDQNEQYRIKKL
jgi:ribulose-5-phosphate 4-epimerase/fuculose-1-phosphate aldolase